MSSLGFCLWRPRCHEARRFFLCFQEQSFAGLHRIFYLSIRLWISWTWSLVLELPICEEILEFLVVKFRTVIADQHFRNAMSGKLHLKLGNYSLCCPPVNLNYFKEIGPVVYIIRNVCCPMTNRSVAIFCQKRKGSSCGWSSLQACAGRYVWQIGQRETKSLISALILG